MTREEIESKIAEKLREITKILDDYETKSGYLTLTILPDGIWFNNEHWEGGQDYPDKSILYWEERKCLKRL
jgi:hypothetical protein